MKNPVPMVPRPPPLMVTRAPEAVPEAVPAAMTGEYYDELATSLEASADEPAAAAEPMTRDDAAARARGIADLGRAGRISGETPAQDPINTEEILDIDAALKRMTDATTRSEVADAIVAHARGVFDVCALLVVRDELAMGWKGFGRDLDNDRLETLLVPLGTPSMFKTAADSAEMFAGAAPPSAVHAHLFKILRTPAPRQAVVLPILIKERLVNLLYGHLEGEGVVGEKAQAGLRKLAETAESAYIRLIALQKQGG